MVKTAYFRGKAADVPPPTGFVVGHISSILTQQEPHDTHDILQFRDAPTGDGPEVVDAYKYYWRNGTDAFEEFSWKKTSVRANLDGPHRHWRSIDLHPEFKRWSEATMLTSCR